MLELIETVLHALQHFLNKKGLHWAAQDSYLAAQGHSWRCIWLHRECSWFVFGSLEGPIRASVICFRPFKHRCISMHKDDIWLCMVILVSAVFEMMLAKLPSFNALLVHMLRQVFFVFLVTFSVCCFTWCSLSSCRRSLGRFGGSLGHLSAPLGGIW